MYRLKVSDTKVTHFTQYYYTAHVYIDQKSILMKWTKHIRKT